jgi:hypothetical protein
MSARKSNNGDLSQYKVKMVPMKDIKPSPENDDLYGKIKCDEQMDRLIDSIKDRGLGDPLLLTKDKFILSGHRRHFAIDILGYQEAPCYFSDITHDCNSEFHKALAEYNPQRIKGVGSILKEALLRDQSPDDTYAAIEEHNAASLEVDVDFMEVPGFKGVDEITEKKMPFLEAVKKVVFDLQPYWPLSIRQIHYNLLNDPPLTSTPKRSKFSPEKYRYKNNDECYKALSRILVPARYRGHIPFEAIGDPTRPEVLHGGFRSVDTFVHQEIDGFLSGYHRNRQDDQPRHIEILGEKNTIMTMLQRAAQEYYVPLTIGRGFSGPSIWKRMAKRFNESGKSEMTLIIVSDYDPEGFELADDAIRSLRDLWDIPIEGHRIAVTRDQIDELDLASDFNPAKDTSNNYDKFVERTGGDESWECEALPPDYLIDQVKAAIESNMNMDIYNQIVEDEQADCDHLWEVKQSIAEELQL